MATTQEMLDNVNDAINARLTGGAVSSYEIDGRNLKYIPIDDLLKLRTTLQNEVGLAKGSKNYASFKRPI